MASRTGTVLRGTGACRAWCCTARAKTWRNTPLCLTKPKGPKGVPVGFTHHIAHGQHRHPTSTRLWYHRPAPSPLGQTPWHQHPRHTPPKPGCCRPCCAELLRGDTSKATEPPESTMELTGPAHYGTHAQHMIHPWPCAFWAKTVPSGDRNGPAAKPKSLPPLGTT